MQKKLPCRSGGGELRVRCCIRTDRMLVFPCLRSARDVVRIQDIGAPLAAQGTAFEHVVPHGDDAGGDDLGEHVVDAEPVDEHPHEELVEDEPCDARAEEEDFCAARLGGGAVKDVDEAEAIVDKDGDAEGDPRREEIVEPGVLCEDVEQSVVEQEAAAADEEEAENFVKSGWHESPRMKNLAIRYRR